MTDVYHQLERELGRGNVVRDEERLDRFGRDESGFGPFPPEAAVLCQSDEQVQLVLRLAREHRIPVTPRGAGTGTTGGALAVRGGIVLSTERMRRVLEVDPDNRWALVEPGVLNCELRAAVEAEQMFYAPDPASLDSCSLGGNVAENAGGPLAFKYGVTRDWILGLDVVLMGGEMLRLGRRTLKGVTGYDLVSSFVGSEGTLGVVTAIRVKLIGKPETAGALLAAMPDAISAGKTVGAIIRRGHRPRALELMDGPTLEHLRRKHPGTIPDGAGAALLVELDGEAEAVEAAVLACGELCEEHGAREVLVARDDADRNRFWAMRRAASPALREAHRFKQAEDIAVPPAAIPEMLRRAAAIGVDQRVTVASFGHAGDGNLHVNVLTDEDPALPSVRARLDAAIDSVFRAALDLGGTLSGEHGIGIAKASYLGWEQPEPLMDWERRLKRMWDPEDLLNPGKIFPGS